MAKERELEIINSREAEFDFIPLAYSVVENQSLKILAGKLYEKLDLVVVKFSIDRFCLALRYSQSIRYNRGE